MKKIAHLFGCWGLIYGLSFGIAHSARAAEHAFIFWYPGGGGNTAQAQPLLDQFAAYLGSKTSNVTWHAKYFGNVESGLQFARAGRPSFGIVSYLMYAQYGQALGMQRILTAVPLAHGKAEESWHFVEGQCDETPAPLIIYMSEPLTLAMIHQDFPNQKLERAGQPAKLQTTGNLLGMLKQIAAGSCHAAIVSEREWHGVSRTSWARDLHSTVSNTTHPAALVVRFTGATSESATKTEETLRGMSGNVQGKAILTELQLKGFE
ncbi:MAG: hypothetical protein HY696_05775 [Deltaproteobacteria bacterium]|nr:hypothetical protein [Deltaproteobacteria bacterium]